MTQEFPFVRVTVLGHGGCGKTALVNSYVNNCCPPVYQETEWPTLYYKVVRLPSDDEESDEVVSMLLEIEDTYGSERADEGRNVKRFLKMERTEIGPFTKDDDLTPFGVYQQPRSMTFAEDKYHTLTHGRMAFIIVFDVTDRKSWQEAVNLHQMLEADMARREQERKERSPAKPVIFLVGNKIDKDGDDVEEISGMAEAYSQQKFVPLCLVSATEFKGVKKLFREVLRLLRGNQALWLLEAEEESSDEEREDKGGVCRTQ
eukprot:GDKI01027326.1.p1 GENE.GDKI01027326.1~~GDKI01027326.1.p1  ORF type:complete len:260 (+),score=78.21 GDKI01027326.1:144-923(+)